MPARRRRRRAAGGGREREGRQRQRVRAGRGKVGAARRRRRGVGGREQARRRRCPRRWRRGAKPGRRGSKLIQMQKSRPHGGLSPEARAAALAETGVLEGDDADGAIGDEEDDDSMEDDEISTGQPGVGAELGASQGRRRARRNMGTRCLAGPTRTWVPTTGWTEGRKTAWKPARTRREPVRARLPALAARRPGRRRRRRRRRGRGGEGEAFGESRPGSGQRRGRRGRAGTAKRGGRPGRLAVAVRGRRPGPARLAGPERPGPAAHHDAGRCGARDPARAGPGSWRACPSHRGRGGAPAAGARRAQRSLARDAHGAGGRAARAASRRAAATRPLGGRGPLRAGAASPRPRAGAGGAGVRRGAPRPARTDLRGARAPHRGAAGTGVRGARPRAAAARGVRAGDLRQARWMGPSTSRRCAGGARAVEVPHRLQVRRRARPGGARSASCAPGSSTAGRTRVC